MAANRAGWLTLHEVLETTGLPYGRLMELIDEGRLTREACGAAELFDPDDVAHLAGAAPAE